MKTALTSAPPLLLALAFPAVAQTPTGSVHGTVFDQQGRALPSASVTLTGKTGARSVDTDNVGAYRFVALGPGRYAVQAELSGFNPKRQEGLQIGIGTQLEVDLVLGLGGVEETVEVVAEAPVVDVESSKTDNSLSQEMLFNLPLYGSWRMNYAPGVTAASAFGADAWSSNAMLLDGVNTSDPEGGGVWVVFSERLIEEIHVGGLGAPAEFGAFTGAVVNAVTKSGGNRFAGLFEALCTKEGLTSDNTSEEVAAQNSALAEAALTRSWLDLTAQLSGPIVPDRLFFFVSATHRTIDLDPAGPSTSYEFSAPRLFTKLTFQPSSRDHVAAFVQSDNWFETGKAGVPWGLATDELTSTTDSLGWEWGVTWRHLFGSRTFGELKYAGWTGFWDWNPTPGPLDEVPGHYDGSTGQYSSSQGWTYYSDRGRHQVNASLSHHAEAFGKHDLKFGLEVERSRLRHRADYGVFYYDYTAYYPVGQYTAYTYGYDVEGRNQRESVFLQDSWQPAGRLTVNAGLRLDWLRGRSPVLDETVYDQKNWAPRLGLAFDLTGDNKSVLKAHYGRYYEAGFVRSFAAALPGIEDLVLHCHPDVAWCEPGPNNVVGPEGHTFTEYDRFGSVPYGVDPEMRHPYVDEVTVGFERALTNDVRLSVTGIWRDSGHFQGSVSPNARWSPRTVTNDLTREPLTVYWWENRDQTGDDFLLTNPDGFEYLDPEGNVLGTAKAERRYRGLMLVLDKRFSKRWQGRVSYVLSRTEGTVDNLWARSFGASERFESPSLALVNREGRLTNDQTHELKIMATYEIPVIDLSVNAYFRSISGRTWTPYQQFSSRIINFPSGLGRRVFLEPRGSRRRDTWTQLDLRLEKTWNPGDGGDRIGVYVDLYNALNAGTITGVQDRHPDTTIEGFDQPVLLGAPTGVVWPREIDLGLRWSF